MRTTRSKTPPSAPCPAVPPLLRHLQAEPDDAAACPQSGDNGSGTPHSPHSPRLDALTRKRPESWVRPVWGGIYPTPQTGEGQHKPPQTGQGLHEFRAVFERTAPVWGEGERGSEGSETPRGHPGRQPLLRSPEPCAPPARKRHPCRPCPAVLLAKRAICRPSPTRRQLRPPVWGQRFRHSPLSPLSPD